jgi:hypothetical protein
MKSEKRNVLAKLKIWLLQGKTITGLQALNKFGTMRLAEYVRVLRKDHGLDIKMQWVVKNGKRFGEYWLTKPKRENRISTRQYMQQA